SHRIRPARAGRRPSPQVAPTRAGSVSDRSVHAAPCRRGRVYSRPTRRERSTMEYRNLGRSGLQVSVVGLGTNNFGRRCDLEASKRVVDAALDAGITLFDTANTYGPGGLSEEYLG